MKFPFVAVPIRNGEIQGRNVEAGKQIQHLPSLLHPPPVFLVLHRCSRSRLQPPLLSLAARATADRRCARCGSNAAAGSAAPPPVAGCPENSATRRIPDSS